jgi:hypothetical protein
MDSNQCETFVPKEQMQIIKINARGEKFETFASKLLSIRYFQNMLGNNGQTASLPDKDGYYFIDQSKDLIYHMMAYVESGFMPTDTYSFDYLKVVFGSFGIPLEKVEKEDISIIINEYLETLTEFIKNTKIETYVVFIDVEEHKYGGFTEIRKNIFTYNVPKLFHEICDLNGGIRKVVDVKGRIICNDNGKLHIRVGKAKGKARKIFETDSDSDDDSYSDHEEIIKIDVKHIIDSSKLEIIKIGEGIFKGDPEDYWNPAHRIVFNKNDMVAYGVLSNDGEVKELTSFEYDLLDHEELEYNCDRERHYTGFSNELEKFPLEYIMEKIGCSSEEVDALKSENHPEAIHQFYVEHLQGYPLYLVLFEKYLKEHDSLTLLDIPFLEYKKGTYSIKLFNSWINMKQSVSKLWVVAFSTLCYSKMHFENMAEVSKSGNLPPESFVYLICEITQQYLDIIFLDQDSLIKELQKRGLKTTGEKDSLIQRLLTVEFKDPIHMTMVEWAQVPQNLKDLSREKYLLFEKYLDSL